MPKQIILLFLLLFVFSSCDFTPAGEYYNKALELRKEKKIEEAIANLDKAIAKEPKFRPALLNRGVYKSIVEDYQGSITDYKKLLAFDGDNTMALYNIGNSYSALKEHNKAITYYTKALKTEGALKSFPSSNGGVIAFQMNFDLKSFDSDMNYNVYDSEIYFDRGVEFLEIEKFDKAISDINKSLKANYAVKDSYFYLGKAYIGKKDSLLACQNFIESARLGDQKAREMLKQHCIKQESK
ncbi:tetratricopeptide repeat protein [uncultured Dokdonia sp.]|uniref:tetratricopeptide repeat protein n=1 Tax=uncultured Dokdonia sp. TaxID=575653 RepID=UPI00261A2CF3|nr:tetratricopeptide repeat protein [uncultured Dokdonia sp.]